MNKPSKLEWETYYEEGKRFADIINLSSGKTSKFTPEILYNIACMSIEKLFMACFLKNNKMPLNHTLLDLLSSMDQIYHVPAELKEKMIQMNSYQEICSIEQYERKIPTQDNVQSFIETVSMAEKFIDTLVN